MNNIVFLCSMVTLWTLVVGVLICIYCLLMIVYRYYFVRLPIFIPNNPLPSDSVFFTIIIPARNESKYIERCVHSVFRNHFPLHLFEVIVVDDYSEDTTPDLVRNLQTIYPQLRLLQLQDYPAIRVGQAYKKKAIELAIQQSKGNWIVTTDADCEVPPNWLALMNAYIEQYNPVIVAAPVMFFNGKGVLSIFQQLDFLSLQGITAASVSAGFHSMCNGANLAYRKDIFEEVGGFSGHEHLATGDDMLLMHQIKKQYPNRVGFLFSKDAIVYTEPAKSWNAFLQQRIRWASKADKYREKKIFSVLLIVWLLNALLTFGLILMLFQQLSWISWLVLMLIKTISELYLLTPVARFFHEERLLTYFPCMQPLHIIYTSVAGWLGKWGSYQWKSRTIQTGTSAQ
ncbi:MAG: glycosyltransferase [Chitinophagia bacterium]|nr:glycosyltransferase [Chitinophagia bacterium]